jgi:phosphoglycolate phosphatase-like HAD superfamily hydrolase
MKKLVLFDIDGTLIDPGGAGRKSLGHTFGELFDIRDAFGRIKMAGKTDIQIIKEGLTAHGLSSDDHNLPSILSVYLKHLRAEILNKEKYINPGVVELLNTLKAMDGYWLGLLTGNIEPGARIKLGAFDLNAYFSVGAFGDDDENRNHLLPIAIEKFRKMTDIRINSHDCIVIGDTPSDVLCAKPYGAVSIAVSTGPYSYDALLETEANYVLKDLSCAMDVIRKIRV